MTSSPERIVPSTFDPREKAALLNLLDRGLREDATDDDVTTGLLMERCGTLPLLLARILARAEGVVAGLGAVEMALRRHTSGAQFKGLHVRYFKRDGDRVAPGEILACVTGPADLLHCRERLLMNILGHLSGVATLTRAFVDAVEGTHAHILHTRKTTPGLRELDIYAVRCGGGQPHRANLSGAVLLKENHFATLPGKTYEEAVGLLLPAGPETVVEAASLDQALAATRAGADVVMLDNFPLAELAAAVTALRAAPRPPGSDAVLVEVSGGVHLGNARQVAEAGPDRISVGALTHSAPQLDLTFLAGAISTRHLRPPPPSR